MKRRITTIIVAAVGLLALVTSTATAADVYKVSWTYDFTGSLFYAPCGNAEPVLITSGAERVRLTSAITIPGVGPLDMVGGEHFQIIRQVVGVGTITGTTYHFVFVDNQATPAQPSKWIISQRYMVLGDGPDNDYVSSIQWNLTVDYSQYPYYTFTHLRDEMTCR